MVNGSSPTKVYATVGDPSLTEEVDEDLPLVYLSSYLVKTPRIFRFSGLVQVSFTDSDVVVVF